MAHTAAIAETAPTKTAETPAKWRKFKVDLWATDLNLTEIGIMKDEQHRSASRQFTRDMEIFGQVVEGGKREGLIAFRQELWKQGKDTKKRLVIKLFTETLNWRGTIDMMMGRSLQLSLGAGGIPVTAFSINLARHDQLVQLERSAAKWPFLPEKFTFFILGDDGPKFYRLRRNVIGIGADYTLYDQKGRKVGRLDNRIVNLGGAWKVKVRDELADAKLVSVLQMFCAMLKYNRASKRHVARLAEQVLRGRVVPELDHQEEDLYMNPRRVR